VVADPAGLDARGRRDQDCVRQAVMEEPLDMAGDSPDRTYSMRKRQVRLNRWATLLVPIFWPMRRRLRATGASVTVTDDGITGTGVTGRTLGLRWGDVDTVESTRQGERVVELELVSKRMGRRIILTGPRTARRMIAPWIPGRWYWVRGLSDFDELAQAVGSYTPHAERPKDTHMPDPSESTLG
jgi:hypothetical protein